MNARANVATPSPVTRPPAGSTGAQDDHVRVELPRRRPPAPSGARRDPRQRTPDPSPETIRTDRRPGRWRGWRSGVTALPRRSRGPDSALSRARIAKDRHAFSWDKSRDGRRFRTRARQPGQGSIQSRSDRQRRVRDEQQAAGAAARRFMRRGCELEHRRGRRVVHRVVLEQVPSARILKRCKGQIQQRSVRHDGDERSGRAR